MLDAGFHRAMARLEAPLTAREPAAVFEAVRPVAWRVKARAVARDPFERTGERASLNLGHTVGHALETSSGGRLEHGEAVAWGLLAALQLSVTRAGLPRGTAEALAGRVVRLVRAPRPSAAAVRGVSALLRADKKADRLGLRAVLLARPGRAVLVRVRGSRAPGGVRGRSCAVQYRRMGVARLPRLRIVTALLVALVLVSIVPLALLHFNLIRINRDALETAEKKYLKNSSVTLADSFDTYITNAQSQLKKIADGIRLASSMSADPFFYLSKKRLLSEYADAESSFPVLRALDRDGVASASDSAALDPVVELPLRQAYNAAMRGDVYVADPIFPPSLPDGALVLAVPVRPAEGQEPIGVVEALLSLRFIKARLDEEGRAASSPMSSTGRARSSCRATPRPSARRTSTIWTS